MEIASSSIGHIAGQVPVRLNLDGHIWEYVSCGVGAETLLLLPGAPGRAETSFEYVEAFAPKYRVIATGYPATVTTIAALVDGIAGLMRAEQVSRLSIVGGSYSGLVAQCLVRGADAATIRRLVLADTGIPRPARAHVFRIFLALLERSPLPCIHGLMWLGADLFVRELGANRDVWRAYFHNLIATVTREECCNLLRTWIDFDQNYHFGPDDLQGWMGQILIIEAAHDPVFPRGERAALKRLYPSARTHTFAGSGHAASLARSSEYVALIDEFLREEPA